MLYIIRHGETEGNCAQILQGQMQGQLTPHGQQQAIDAGARIQVQMADAQIAPLHAIIASDLKRTVDTAQLINRALHLPLHTTPLLRERDWGELTGLPYHQVRGREELPASVESLEAMTARLHAFFAQLEANWAGQNLLLVTHGYTARLMQALALNCSPRDIAPMQNVELRPLHPPTIAAPSTRPDEVGATDS